MRVECRGGARPSARPKQVPVMRPHHFLDAGKGWALENLGDALAVKHLPLGEVADGFLRIDVAGQSGRPHSALHLA
jgi:hypothetical protein